MTVDAKAIKAVFFAALDRDTPTDRVAFLDEACAGDALLRQRVAELLELHHRLDPLLDKPVAALHLTLQDELTALGFLEPSPKPGSLGQLGHYEIKEVVGQGGMGIVLRAFDEKLQRVVAIKVLAPALAGSGPARQRFVREARAAAAVTHEHIVAIHAVEDTGSIPFLVMQLVNGRNLQEKLDSTGPLPLAEILRVGLQIAEGLAAAHRQGLIHRDIKPANILLENGIERVKITDFGLARAVDDASLTQSGVIAGTPAYMSPEQANGEKVDQRSDLFSLGSVMYTMCAGHPPFRADTTMAVLKRVCEDTPRSIREVNPAIPPWLEAIVVRLHSKDPACRFATAQEVAHLLTRGLAQAQTGAEPGTSLTTVIPHRHAGPGRRVAAVVAVVAVVFCGVAWWFLAGPGASTPAHTSHPEEAPEPWRPRAPLTQEELARLRDPLDEWRREDIPLGLLLPIKGQRNIPSELIGLVGDGRFRLPFQELTHWPAQTTDGRLLALPCGDTVVLYDARTGELLRLLLGHTDRAYQGSFSPDDKRFACGSRNGFIRVWDVASGKEEAKCQDPGNDIWTTLFSGDGQQLVSAGSQGAVKVWDARTGNELKTLDAQKTSVTTLAFNPKHTRLVSGGLDGVLKVRDWPKGNELKKLEGIDKPVQRVAFSSDGALLAAGGQYCVIIWDAATFQPLQTGLCRGGGGVVAFTPDGRTLVTAPHQLHPGLNRAFTRWNVKSGTALANSDVAGLPGALVGDLSVDGRAVYLMTCSPPEARLGVFDVVSGKERFSNHSHSGSVASVAFSPDGHWLASGGIDSQVCLWDLTRRPSRDSGLSVRQLPGHTAEVSSVAFSPDGRLLATGSRDRTIRLWNVADGRATQVLAGHSAEPALLAFSPDGKTVAAGGEDGAVNFWDVKTGLPNDPVGGHAGPVRAVAFSPDGRWWASGGADKTVHLIDRASGKRLEIFRGESPFTGLAFSPDSKTLAATCEVPGPSLRFWDLTTKKERTLTGHVKDVTGLAFHPAGDLVLTGSLDGTIRLWETTPGKDAGRLFEFLRADGCHAVAFSPSGRHFAVGLANGTIAVLNTP